MLSCHSRHKMATLLPGGWGQAGQVCVGNVLMHGLMHAGRLDTL